MTRHQLKESGVGWGTKKDAGCEGLRACVVDVEEDLDTRGGNVMVLQERRVKVLMCDGVEK